MAKTKAKNKTKAVKAKAKAKSKAGSIRTWLAANIGKGTKLADAVAHAKLVGRSEVTVRRQAGELGFKVKAGVFAQGGK